MLKSEPLMYIPNLEVEKKEILRRYRNLLRVWKPRNPGDRGIVKKAFKMALEAHKDMRRKSGEPYIYHPLGVATIAAGEIGLGTTSVICALLHDVVEDTEYSIEDIRGLFGDKVAIIIDGLTKIKGIFDQQTVYIGAENFKKILLTLSDDVRVILIKLADRLHNMRTLDALSHEKRVKISSETTYLYAPLAHRLGLHAIKSELEDLALKYTEPEVYETIARKLKESAKGRSRFVSKFIYPIKKSLTHQGFNYTIKAREKSIAAIWLKMQKKEVPFEEVYDIFAIRIVIDSPFEAEKADCWKVYSTITDFYRPNMERLRDWISIPKANGYEALHTTVMSHNGQWVEIQIRSKRMDEVAEKGYAAHWKYKESLHMNSRLDNWLDRIKEMIESPDSDALSFIDDVKGYFFLEEISVFTPQGELRTLPANSTVLDFAYAIHSELGDTCIGAKIDKKLAPINQTLKNGQQIEIITSLKQTPKEEWLSYVVTTRAKTNIKMAVKTEKKKFAKPGRDKLARWFHQMGIEFNNANIKKFIESNNFSSLVDLYYAAAQDKIGIKDVKIFVASSFRNGWLSYITRKSAKASSAAGVEVEGLQEKDQFPETLNQDQAELETLSFEVAGCCHPIPGDEVIGLIAEDKAPLQLHRTNCQTVIEQVTKYNSKIIKVNWNNHQAISFLTDLKILGVDKIGIIHDVTNVISNDMNLNIKALHMDSVDGLAEGTVSFYVHNTAGIADAIDRLQKVEGITNVVRISKT